MINETNAIPDPVISKDRYRFYDCVKIIEALKPYTDKGYYKFRMRVHRTTTFNMHSQSNSFVWHIPKSEMDIRTDEKAKQAVMNSVQAECIIDRSLDNSLREYIEVISEPVYLENLLNSENDKV